MKTKIQLIIAAMVVGLCGLGAEVKAITSTQLRVDSVTVDSVWVTDSLWYDVNNILQSRTSRDMVVSYLPQGTGVTSVDSIFISQDSGKTWNPQPDPILKSHMCGYLSLTGKKHSVIIRYVGTDHDFVSFKLCCFQYAPSGIRWQLSDTSMRGTNATIKIMSQMYHFANITKYYWTTLGNGSIQDSTIDSIWSFQANVPLVGDTIAKVMVTARDANGLMAYIPETVTVVIPTRYTLSVQSINGTVNPSFGNYMAGTKIVLTKTANVGYLFDHWGGVDSAI